MAGRVTEKWSSRAFTRGKSARRVFEVDGGPTTDALAQSEVATQMSVTYGSQHPLDTALTVPAGGIDVELVIPGLYRVTANYEANAVSGDTTSLFTKKWQVLPLETIYEDVPADLAIRSPQDPPTGSDPYLTAMVSTSAMTPVADGITRRISYYRFRLRRYEAGTDLLSKNLAFQNKWNHDIVTLPRYGNAIKGQLKVVSISQVDGQEQGASTGVLVEYVFEAKPLRRVKYDGGTAVFIHGWHRRILDQDVHALIYDGALVQCEICPRNASAPEPVTEPVLLNGKGWPLHAGNYIVRKRNNTTGAMEEASPTYDSPIEFCVPESTPNGAALASANAVYLNWDTTEGPVLFSGLNIAANL